MLDASVFLAENKNGLLKMMDREAAGSARAAPVFKATTSWLKGYDAITPFIKANKKGLLKVLDRETGGAARLTTQYKGTTRWIKYFGKKWYFAYLF